MAQPMEKMKLWIDSFAGDVAAVQALTENDQVARDSRLAGAAALNYLVTRLDLIPDWEESCGILDDAMVLRLAMFEAAGKDLEALPPDVQKTIHRLANETDVIREFLGADLYAKLDKYVHELARAVVRGRAPHVVVDDAKERGHLYEEIANDLKRTQPPMNDPAQVARIVKNYLSQKLQ